MIPTLLQISEAAQHAPRIIDAARPLADTDRGLVLGVILLLAVLVIGGIALGALALRRVREVAPQPDQRDAFVEAVISLPLIVGAMGDKISARLDGLEAALGGRIDGLTERVKEQGETLAEVVPERTATALASRRQEVVIVTPHGGDPAVTEEQARRRLRAAGEE